MNKNVQEIIKKETIRLDKLKAKRAELDEAIKKCESKIEKYTLVDNNAKFTSFTTSLASKGVSVEEILLAVQSGDLLSLQEKIENAETNNNDSEDEETETV